MSSNRNVLPDDDFKFIIKKTPLISIDLIIESKDNKILLGLRKNRPAKGCWFVPGGRILKDETIEDAYNRICTNELGLLIPFSKANFIGVYQHLYPDNFFDDSFSTHYVVLAYRLPPIDENATPPFDQHQQYDWLKTPNLLSNPEVHENTKAYFRPTDR